MTISEIKRVNWYHYKNVSAETKPYAVEVLMGPAKYYPAMVAEQKKMRKEKQLGITPPNWDASLLEGKPDTAISRSVPERVRIWSIPILLMLAEFNDDNIESIPTHVEAHLRSFKNLLRFRDEIHTYIDPLEAKWGATEQTSQSSNPTSNDKPQDPKNTITISDSSSHVSDGNVAEAIRTEPSSINTGETSKEPATLPTINKPNVKVDSKTSESVYDKNWTALKHYEIFAA